MRDLGEQLSEVLQGRVCLVGLGNESLGDDGVGMRLARRCQEELLAPKAFGSWAGPQVLLAGLSPERHLAFLADGGFDHVLFLDAVAFGGEPGSVVLLEAREMESRFPQVSTHRLSLGLLARMIEGNRRTQAHLLGVQPGSLKSGATLSSAVAAAAAVLVEVLVSGSEQVVDPVKSVESGVESC